MRKVGLLISFFLIGLFFATSIPVLAEVSFSRDLKIGDRGLDVKELQIFLNSDPDTVVAYSGFGSSGNETEYFGELTKSAVIKFQNKYASEVLYTIGLSYGTGYVGPMTKQKILELTQNLSQTNSVSVEPVSPTVDPTPSVSAPVYSVTNTKPQILSITPEVITERNQTITITGQGFTANNTILVSGEPIDAFDGVASLNGNQIQITLSLPVVETIISQIEEVDKLDTDDFIDALNEDFENEELDIESQKGIFPIVVYIENQNGNSEPFEINLDLIEILKSL